MRTEPRGAGEPLQQKCTSPGRRGSLSESPTPLFLLGRDRISELGGLRSPPSSLRLHASPPSHPWFRFWGAHQNRDRSEH